MLFQDAILEFGFDCKVRKLSPKSINNYQKQLRYLQNYDAEGFIVERIEEKVKATVEQEVVSPATKPSVPEIVEELPLVA